MPVHVEVCSVGVCEEVCSVGSVRGVEVCSVGSEGGVEV